MTRQRFPRLAGGCHNIHPLDGVHYNEEFSLQRHRRLCGVEFESELAKEPRQRDLHLQQRKPVANALPRPSPKRQETEPVLSLRCRGGQVFPKR